MLSERLGLVHRIVEGVDKACNGEEVDKVENSGPFEDGCDSLAAMDLSSNQESHCDQNHNPRGVVDCVNGLVFSDRELVLVFGKIGGEESPVDHEAAEEDTCEGAVGRVPVDFIENSNHGKGDHTD